MRLSPSLAAYASDPPGGRKNGSGFPLPFLLEPPLGAAGRVAQPNTRAASAQPLGTDAGAGGALRGLICS